jgi:hypothetical protein
MGTVVVALILVGGACSSNAEGQAGRHDPVETAATTVQSGPQVEEHQLVLPARLDQVPGNWSLVLEVPYGPADNQLGVSDDHDGQTEALGPEFAAPRADGSFWILDIHKRRAVLMDRSGTLQQVVEIPGRYVGLQGPFVLGDTLWASGGGQGGALVVEDGVATRVDDSTFWAYSDGVRLYETNGSASLVPAVPPLIEAVDAFRTPNGVRFAAEVRRSEPATIDLTLPDSDLETRLTFMQPDGDTPVQVLSFELAADFADRLYFLVYGLGQDNAQRLGALVAIDARSGELLSVEPTRDPYLSAADPSSPAHLRVVPGTTKVALTYEDPDALRIYEQEQPAREVP